jgi:hypothetical protein
MKNLLVVMVFAMFLVGCGSAPVFVEPAVVPVIETPHEKKAPLEETITTVKGGTLDANGKLVGGVVDQIKTELNPRMAEYNMKMALIAAPKPQAAIDPCASNLAPAICWGEESRRVSPGYNTTYQTGGGVHYTSPRYAPPPPIERPAGKNTNY